MTNKELQELLSTYPDDAKVKALGIREGDGDPFEDMMYLTVQGASFGESRTLSESYVYIETGDGVV